MNGVQKVSISYVVFLYFSCYFRVNLHWLFYDLCFQWKLIILIFSQEAKKIIIIIIKTYYHANSYHKLKCLSWPLVEGSIIFWHDSGRGQKYSVIRWCHLGMTPISTQNELLNIFYRLSIFILWKNSLQFVKHNYLIHIKETL